MAEKYIRVSNYLHEKIKLRSIKRRLSMKELVEIYLWAMLKKNERSTPHDKSKR